MAVLKTYELPAEPVQRCLSERERERPQVLNSQVTASVFELCVHVLLKVRISETDLRSHVQLLGPPASSQPWV